MTGDFEQVKHLITYMTGDEKHDESSNSTLDVLWVLYDRVMRYDPKNPRMEQRDRFVLSKGHGPEAFYAVLAHKGFFPKEELKTFMQWDSILGAHPDRNKVPGAETSTGSLGHGLPMAIGMAMALQLKENDRRVFALIGDGECNEGSIWESILLAGSRKLNNLTTIVINNFTSAPDLGDIAEKFAAFGWHATTVNGRDHEQIYAALTYQDEARPTAVVALIHK
ncbi:MAG TPA: thiamine pyrophosphate-dependent enzyme [Ktedonobacteraceae bacterium]|jgi:transketolase|nr:thiamine pyrophosphate-dependent enzyme [Ktedonobacteraceae bacterium]